MEKSNSVSPTETLHLKADVETILKEFPYEVSGTVYSVDGSASGRYAFKVYYTVLLYLARYCEVLIDLNKDINQLKPVAEGEARLGILKDSRIRLPYDAMSVRSAVFHLDVPGYANIEVIYEDGLWYLGERVWK